MSQHCPNCESEDLAWETTVRTSTSAPLDGMLSLHDVEAVCVLGCNECSETVKVVPSYIVDEQINILLKIWEMNEPAI